MTVTINYQPCQSSQIEAWGYDAASQTLGIKFVRGATYHYIGVSQEVADSFAKAESAGKFFGGSIKNKFNYERQPDQPGGIVFGLAQTQEPKYTTTQHGRIVSRSTGKVIPDDEPVFILRAQDVHAVDAIIAYSSLCESSEHRAAVLERAKAFQTFADAHAERMKEPSTVGAVREPVAA